MNRIKYLACCVCLFAVYHAGAQLGQSSNYYYLDRSHSELDFSIKWMKSGKVTGTFDNIAGTIYYDPKKPSELSATLKISIKTLSTGIPLRDAALMKEWFDTANHSFAYFESLPLSKQDKPGKIKGNFTLKGITKVITLDVDKIEPPGLDYQNDPFVVVSGKTFINRKDFNVTMPTSRYETSANDMVAISDSVLIEFNLLGKQTSAKNAFNRINQPGSRNALLYEAMKVASPADIRQRLDSFYKTPAANPGQDFSAWYVGTYFLTTNDLQKAIPILLKGLEQFPNSPITHDAVMQAYYESKDTEEAKKWMNKLLALDPHHPNALEYKRRL
ncbi:MAG TPA: YceI family protein [Chitinophagaceae bacterium]|nr:YceI family protein [Chitinophagaceae bacterium]